MGLTRWADYVETDIAPMPPPTIEMEGFLSKLDVKPQSQLTEVVDLPDHINWKADGYVTAVKETDKKCFISSYAFATADIVEYLYKKQSGTLKTLSTRQLMDCGGDYSLNDCYSGTLLNALKYLKSGKKLESEESYPYVSEPKPCAYDSSKAIAGITDYQLVEVDPTRVKEALLNGPVATKMNWDEATQLYKGGIIRDQDYDKCTYVNKYSYVLIVGYDTDKTTGEEYFLIKHSQGPDWGEEGYVRVTTSVQKTHDGICGILTKGNLFQVEQS